MIREQRRQRKVVPNLMLLLLLPMQLLCHWPTDISYYQVRKLRKQAIALEFNNRYSIIIV